MTVPADVLTFAIDNLAVPQAIRNHSGNRGVVDWNRSATAPATITAISASGAGTYGGTCFRFTDSTGAGTPMLMRSALVPVTPGWKCEVAYKATKTGTVTSSVTVSFLTADAETIIGSPTTIGTLAADATGVVTVPATASYAVVTATHIGNASPSTSNLAAVTVRQAATTGELTAGNPPESWLDVTGVSTTINVEYGNSLDGVEDQLEPGSLVAVINDASIDPNTDLTIRRGRRYVIFATVAGSPVYVAEGKLEEIDVDYDADERTIVTLTGTDINRLLNDTTVQSVDDLTGSEAIQAIAAKAGATSFDGTAMPNPTSGTLLARGADSAATWIKRCCNTLTRRAWVDSRNVLQQRTVAALGTSPVATLSDTNADVGALFYTGISMSYGSKTCVNALNVTRFNVSEVFDNGAKTYGPYIASSSEGANGRSEKTLEILSGSPSAAAAAVLPMFSEPTIFPRQVRLNALHNLAGVLALQPYQPIRVKRSTVFDETVRLLRIRHEITASKWVTILTFRPLETATAGVIVTDPIAGADTGPADIIPVTKPMHSRERTATSTVATATQTKVNFTATVQNDGIPWDSTTQSFTAPRSGRYDVDLSVEWLAGATGIRRTYLKVNGASVKRHTLPASSAENVTNTIAWNGHLEAGDLVTVWAYHNAGANRQTDGSETSIQIKYAD